VSDQLIEEDLGCLYCQGYRTRCNCTEDCGARPENPASHGHYCWKGAGFEAWRDRNLGN
jgi:hypothetical protein